MNRLLYSLFEKLSDEDCIFVMVGDGGCWSLFGGCNGGCFVSSGI